MMDWKRKDMKWESIFLKNVGLDVLVLCADAVERRRRKPLGKETWPRCHGVGERGGDRPCGPFAGLEVSVSPLGRSGITFP